MTGRERLLTVLQGNLPDCVPVAPDFSNMIPCAMTGKPFWDIYLYEEIPCWKAYLDAAKYFDIDALMDGYVPIQFEELGDIDYDWEEVIVGEEAERIVTQRRRKRTNGWEWADRITVYPIANSPAVVRPSLIHYPDVPDRWHTVEKKHIWPQGEALLRMVKQEMGDQGLVGVWCGASVFLHNEDEVYQYFDDPGYFEVQRDEMLEQVERRFNILMSLPLDARPDFLCTGGSGTLVFQTVDIFRSLALPVVQKVTAMAKRVGIPSHVHSCGPERALVQIMAEETDLTVIDPLEIPPMGDCNLRELKKLYGDKLVLKGNLHTTDVMLNGSAEEVRHAAMQAIDDAAAGGGFILSTGDQCGRDTPHENLFAMVETARTYGRYGEG